MLWERKQVIEAAQMNRVKSTCLKFQQEQTEKRKSKTRGKRSTFKPLIWIKIKHSSSFNLGVFLGNVEETEITTYNENTEAHAVFISTGVYLHRWTIPLNSERNHLIKHTDIPSFIYLTSFNHRADLYKLEIPRLRKAAAGTCISSF